MSQYRVRRHHTRGGELHNKHEGGYEGIKKNKNHEQN